MNRQGTECYSALGGVLGLQHTTRNLLRRVGKLHPV